MKGTVVSAPHSEQVVRVSGRTLCVPRTRFALHCLQCLGSFLNCLSWKKTCSPAVNMKSAPQSVHLSTRSWNSIFGRRPLNRDARRTRPFGTLAGPGSLLSFVMHNKGPVRTKNRAVCFILPVPSGQPITQHANCMLSDFPRFSRFRGVQSCADGSFVWRSKKAATASNHRNWRNANCNCAAVPCPPGPLGGVSRLPLA